MTRLPNSMIRLLDYPITRLPNHFLGRRVARALKLRVRLEMLALLLRQRARQFDLDYRVEVAELAGLADDRHSVTLQPEHLSVLRRRGNPQSERFPRERGHLDFAAEDRRR